MFCGSERLPEHVQAPPSHSREEPRPQVSCRVDGVAAVQPHGHSDGHDDQADAQRLHAFWGADILLVSDGQDAEDECTSSNYLEKQGGAYSTISDGVPQRLSAIVVVQWAHLHSTEDWCHSFMHIILIP